MGFFDNLDTKLAISREIKESLKSFKSKKLKNLNPNLNIYTTFNGKKIKINSKHKKLKLEKFRKEKKIRLNQSKRVYKRCPRDYKVYIASHWWEERKNRYYKTHRKICLACGSTEYVALHHMIYSDYGNEKDEYLSPLCSHCHQELHTKYGVKQNLILETNKFIELKNESR